MNAKSTHANEVSGKRAKSTSERHPPAIHMTPGTTGIYQNSVALNPRTDAVKKLQKQIQAIQNAIKKESQRGLKNSGILKGLKRSLKKLIAAQAASHQKLKSSQEPSLAEKEFQAEAPALQEPTETPPPAQAQATHEPDPESGKPQSLSDPLTIKEQAPSVQAPLVEKSRAEAETEVGLEPETMIGADKNTEYLPLTDNCHHYTRLNQVDWDIQKYWQQRYSIFSLYDEGIHMTDDAWFGVTPEPVANKVASDLASLTPASKTVLIDMFAGAGGNVIAFALSSRWSTIVAIEKNSSVLACAQHNAAIYGVFEQITWINDDSFSYLSSNTSKIDPAKTVIFASPPWGGPGYTSDKVFNLDTMTPYSIKDLTSACKGMDSALFLPRTSDLRQIAKLAPEGKKIEVVQYCMEGASKALVAYLPGTLL